MQTTKDNLYQKIKDLKSRKEFESEIQQQQQHFDGLLSEETIALLLVDELGRNQTNQVPIANLTPDAEYTVRGKITEISETKNFVRKNGTKGKVINLELSDDTGTCRLVLWNKDVNLINNQHITIGSQVKIINGYTKPGQRGIEIHLGRWGSLQVQQEETTQNTLTRIPEQKPPSLSGILTKREATKVFFKDNGDIGFVTTIILKTPEKEHPIILWDTHVKEIQHYHIGDNIQLTDVTQKQKNGKTEFHLNNTGTITPV